MLVDKSTNKKGMRNDGEGLALTQAAESPLKSWEGPKKLVHGKIHGDCAEVVRYCA